MSPVHILDGHAPVVVRAAERLRAIVREAVPEAEERGHPGWHAIGYRSPEAGYFAGIFPREDHVMLVFEWGALLPDPDGVLTGDTRQTRHVIVRRAEDVPEHALKRLLVLAASGRPRRG